jgi:3-hydroxybutyryl-CoA dehydrogenase
LDEAIDSFYTARMSMNSTFTTLLPAQPRDCHAVVIGAGTMGADVAIVLARAGCRVTVTDPSAEKREALFGHVLAGLADLALSARVAGVQAVADLKDVAWADVRLVIECIPEKLPLKQALFAQLADIAPAHTVLASNSSSFPISAIAEGLSSQERMVGLHFFMPAHLVPLVEVVLGPQTALDTAESVCAFMRGCGSVPVLVRKDKPGFLANRLQHALAREAFAMIDEGVATHEDVDAAVRFGFGFRFLAAGPVMQRDHAGLDVHTAAAASMYPSLSTTTEPAQVLRDHVQAGRLGMKTGAGFFEWTPEARLAERQRYDRLLQQGLALLAAELPTLDRSF